MQIITNNYGKNENLVVALAELPECSSKQTSHSHLESNERENELYSSDAHTRCVILSLYCEFNISKWFSLVTLCKTSVTLITITMSGPTKYINIIYATAHIKCVSLVCV